MTSTKNFLPLLRKIDAEDLPMMRRCFRCFGFGDYSIKKIFFQLDIQNLSSSKKLTRNVCNECVSALIKDHKAMMSPVDSLDAECECLFPLVDGIVKCTSELRERNLKLRLAKILYIICQHEDGIHKNELRKILIDLDINLDRSSYLDYLRRMELKKIIGITKNNDMQGIIIPTYTSLHLYYNSKKSSREDINLVASNSRTGSD
jgi:hypothetical protein